MPRMSNKSRKIVLMGLLVITAIWGYDNISKPVLTTERSPTQSTPVAQAPTLDVSGQLSESVVKTLSGRPWGVDPFYDRTTRHKQTSKRPKPKLQAILYNENSPSAYINGRLVRVGDKIGDSRVSEIGPESVKLERDGKTIKLIIKTG